MSITSSNYYYGFVTAVMSALVVSFMGLSMIIGDTALDITAAGADIIYERHSLQGLILMEIRLPRALLGAMVGFSLGIIGAAMQGILHNPLADPGVMGVSGGSALGAVVVFYSGLAASAGGLALPLGAGIGAIVTSGILYAIAGRGAGTMSLVLTGIALNSLAGALTALALNLSPNPYAAMEIVFWMMGSLADHSLSDVALVVIPMLPGSILVLSCSSALNALTLGEDVAISLGFNLRNLRLKIIIGAALAVGSAVAITGMIGFVGLVAPHLVRPLAQHKPGSVLLLSGLSGAILTLCADICLRLLPTQTELNLGVITALVGAPFLFILIQQLKENR